MTAPEPGVPLARAVRAAILDGVDFWHDDVPDDLADKVIAIVRDAVPWQPGRWWSVIGPDGRLWCGTSDEAEARAAMRPGDTLKRQETRTEERWQIVEVRP